MKRMLLLVAMFAAALSLSAQRNMQVWEGNTYSEFSTAMVDSITFLLSPEGTRRECKPDTVFITKTDTITVVKNDTMYIYKWKTIGKFSVSADKRVAFSTGNLQYQASTHTWHFADNQYDYIGAANVSDGALADRIDLFGWSANNTTAPFGVSVSAVNADYAGAFVDWGSNRIGGDVPNTWRTLTIDEWRYLFMHTRWTMAKVNGTLGFMLLPDEFTAPAGMTIAIVGNGNVPSSYLNFEESDYASNQYSAKEFAQLEEMGCVFLPCAGYRNGSDMSNVGTNGYYWSASLYEENYTRYLYFNSTGASSDFWNFRYGGRSVRLVIDLQ